MKPPAAPTGLDLSAERRDYSGPRLLESEAPADPLELFTSWMQRALADRLTDATAMSVSTCSPSGRPSSRMMLLKSHDAEGFVFFTRYSTQKCQDLLANPHAALLFYWRELARQVRVEAVLSRLPESDNRAYFATRPRESQLSARAASGLVRVASAELLDARYQAEAERWREQEVPLPEDWGGFRAKPDRIEFWQGRPGRLHDRLVYELAADGTWTRHRLAP
jgi:pyridoxamine 5'-phosphate oxidase